MNLFEMLQELKDDNTAVFETNNGDMIGFFDKRFLIYSDGSEFLITDYKLKEMTFKRIRF